MASRPKVDWRVLSDEWKHFENHVLDEYDDIEGNIGREVDRAMREWIDKDEYADLAGDYEPIEDRLDRLLEAAGYSPNGFSQKKSVERSGVSTTGDTTLVRVRVDKTLKEEFRSFVKSYTDYRLGEALTQALHERREGGRLRRLQEQRERIDAKLNAIESDLKGVLSDQNDDVDDSLSTVEKRTIKICQRFEGADAFLRTDLAEAIESVAGSSAPTIRQYEERVIDRMSLSEHPNNSDLLCTPEYLGRGDENLNAPAIDRKSPEDLDRDERVEGLQVELARKADKKPNGMSLFRADEVEREVFDDAISTGYANKLMRLASNANGFQYREKDKDQLTVSLKRVDDYDLLEMAGLIESDDVEETEESSDDEAPARIEAEETINTRYAATDGGRDVV